MTKKTNVSCCSRNCAEGVGGRREQRRLRKVGGGVELHGADEERKPRDEQQAEERRFAEQRADAGARDHRPAVPARRRVPP